jgi:ribosome-associated toxin RatA of RatAB toxin-antitoxin module
VEAVVDQMLMSESLRVVPAMHGVQRKLLVNCSVMVLQLLEYLTSAQRMQVTVLGHSLRFRLEPLPVEQIWSQVAVSSGQSSERLIVNTVAIDELVEALLDEPDTQMVFVPDLVEAEVYRAVLHRMICIAQGMLKSVRLTLFGLDIRFDLVAAKLESCADNPAGTGTETVNVLPAQLQTCLDKLEDERRKIANELHKRQEDIESRFAGSGNAAASAPLEGDAAEEETTRHEFETLAAQDRLARSLAIQHTMNVPIEIAYRMLADFDEYPKWMPFCTNAKTIQTCTDEVRCEVAFGLETGTMLGAIGDNVQYEVRIEPPEAPMSDANVPDPSKGPRSGLKTARVVCDAVDGFAYGKRLVWDWRFAEKVSGETAVQLNIFFQAKGVLTLPIWDSLQAMITGVMFKKFTERAAILKAESAAHN